MRCHGRVIIGTSTARRAGNILNRDSSACDFVARDWVPRLVESIKPVHAGSCHLMCWMGHDVKKRPQVYVRQ